MKNEKYECPKCNSAFERSEQYKKTLKLINFTSFESKEAIDFCGKCNHFEYEPKKFDLKG